MADSDLELRREWGSIVVVMDDAGGVESRWWFDRLDEPSDTVSSDTESDDRFDETDAGRLVFVQQVNEYTDDHPCDERRSASSLASRDDEASTVDGRRYMSEAEAYIPDAVRSRLEAADYDTVLDTSGHPC